jgi:hypothetical protein
MGILDYLRKMGSGEGTRLAMKKSYSKHLKQFQRGHTLPPDTSAHEAALYGALATRYRAAGAPRHVLESLEPILWLELIPFVYLEPAEGVEALAEYAVWKEPETQFEARLDWLTTRVKQGVEAAELAGRGADIENAKNIPVQGGHSPWVELV